MASRPDSGKAWDDMSPEERTAAALPHYVADRSKLGPELRTAVERFDEEFANEVAAKEQGQAI